MNTLNSITDNDKDFEYCENLVRSRESNFSIGFELLPAEKKRAIHVVYAFCRYVDDISDDMKGAGVKELLEAWLGELDNIYERKKSEHPIGRALVRVNERFAIPADGFRELIHGCVQDQLTKNYSTFSELAIYCELVATSIAKVSLPVYGTDRYKEAFPHARDLSFAFQLTNILRDVAEDLDRGRLYMPADDLARFGIKPEDFISRVPEKAIADFFLFQGERCERYYAGGRKVLEYLQSDSRPCVRAMTEAYHTILEKILREPIQALRVQTKLDPEEKRRITQGNKI